MDELTIGDKIYISSKRAAEITGYAKDYVGQLCREGRVEATLVGRSWYVLETAIRAHRFGEDESDEAPAADKAAENDALHTWEAPTYKAEATSSIPPLEHRSVNILETEPQAPAEAPAAAPSGPETIADMQSAWKEWFANRNEQRLETPEVVEAREIEASEKAADEILKGEEPIVIHRAAEAASEPVEVYSEPEYDPIPSTPEIEEPVQIHRTYEAQAPAMPVRREVSRRREPVAGPQRHKKRRKGSSLALRALFISIAAIAIGITIVGSGYADQYTQRGGVEYSPVRFLGGTSLIDK